MGLKEQTTPMRSNLAYVAHNTSIYLIKTGPTVFCIVQQAFHQWDNGQVYATHTSTRYHSNYLQMTFSIARSTKLPTYHQAVRSCAYGKPFVTKPHVYTPEAIFLLHDVTHTIYLCIKSLLHMCIECTTGLRANNTRIASEYGRWKHALLFMIHKLISGFSIEDKGFLRSHKTLNSTSGKFAAHNLDLWSLQLQVS